MISAISPSYSRSGCAPIAPQLHQGEHRTTVVANVESVDIVAHRELPSGSIAQPSTGHSSVAVRSTRISDVASPSMLAAVGMQTGYNKMITAALVSVAIAPCEA